jgi:hypothetical protein
LPIWGHPRGPTSVDQGGTTYDRDMHIIIYILYHIHHVNSTCSPQPGRCSTPLWTACWLW